MPCKCRSNYVFSHHHCSQNWAASHDLNAVNANKLRSWQQHIHNFLKKQIGIAPYFETWFQSGCQWAHFLAKLHQVLPICDEYLLSQVCSKASCSSCRFLGGYCKVPLCSPKAWLDPLLHTAQKKKPIFCREKIKDQIFYTQERKKERKTDFIRQRQTWRVFAVNKCQCCCIELRRIQTKKKSHLFLLLLSTTGRTGTGGNKQESFALLCFTLWSYSVALHRWSKKSKQAVHNNSTICICIRLCCCIVKGFHWSCSFLFLFLLLVRLPLLRLVFLVMFLLLLDHIGLLLLHIKWYWI